MNARRFVRTLFTISAILLPALSQAQWTNQTPIRAKLISYDANCALFREASGAQISILRSALGDLKLVTGQTEIQYFTETARKHACPEKTPQS